ncbi:MAG: hypothetical protein JWO72_3044 [Caulobacteraceae bacterium]|nr:hypothetical protein [Caulobacteraceae bacterium]
MRFHILRISLAATLGLSSAAWAHHSAAMFDATKTNTLVGTVTQYQFENPHAWIYLMVVNPGGTQKQYSIEMTSPNLLQRAGWRPATLKPGDRVTVKIHPLHDGSNGGSFVEITLPDGKVMSQQRAG